MTYEVPELVQIGVATDLVRGAGIHTENDSGVKNLEGAFEEALLGLDE
jgi:hypothetical protein